MKLAIIPARGGSKRISRKNVREFAGRPLISWSIIRALESKIFDRVIVSTDDKDIADIALKYGAEVPFIRPAELADDYVKIRPVLRHALTWFRENNYTVNFVCCIFPTAPFLQVDDLKLGLRTANCLSCSLKVKVIEVSYLYYICVCFFLLPFI